MAPVKFSVGLCVALLFAGALPALAQLSPSEPDPLARIRDAAKSSVQACSATGESLCEQVAPKIIANTQGDSPLAENLRQITKALKDHQKGTSEDAAAAWAVAAFRGVGLEAHTEKYLAPPLRSEGRSHQRENVVAEIRGREKPEEWVLLGAHLDSFALSSNEVDEACAAALVIEAARDIQITGVRPRRSIRFVLFGGRVRAHLVRPAAGRGVAQELENDQRTAGSWAYVRGHRDELDRVRAAILFDAGASGMNGFVLNGRRDIESGIREAMKPVGSMGGANLTFDASVGTDSLDFLLEGIPTVEAAAVDAADTGGHGASSNSPEKIDIKSLKRDTAIAAVTVFGIAERSEPLGPRLSRAEIESLLKTTGLAEQMKTKQLWPLWESGERGRLQ
jgi:peptidase M28-like protein